MERLSFYDQEPSIDGIVSGPISQAEFRARQAETFRRMGSSRSRLLLVEVAEIKDPGSEPASSRDSFEAMLDRDAAKGGDLRRVIEAREFENEPMRNI